MSQAPLSHAIRYTVEEYFQLAEAWETRLEYIDGRVIDMAGGSDAHSHINANVIGSLWSRLRGKACQVRDSNLRVRYGRRVQYGYPDALIVCGAPIFEPAGKRPNTTLLNPRVLIEVLSESTEAYDRGLKFERYREIESFEEYVLIAQNRPSVDVFRKQSAGLWTIQPPYQGLEAAAKMVTADIELPLSEIYAGIEFPPESSLVREMQV
jgi:Uma2 family endonuclease